MRVIAVAENRQQVDLVAKGRSRFKDVTLFCLDDDLYNYAAERRLKCVNADKYVRAVPAQKINAWGRQKSLTWFRHPEIEKVFEFNQVNIFNIDWHYVGCTLAWIVKNHEIVQRMIEDLAPRGIVTFDTQDIFTLNYILKKTAKRVKIPSRSYRCSVNGSGRFSPQQIIRGIASAVHGSICLFKKTGPDRPIIVKGPLKHLSPVIEELDQRKQLIFSEKLFYKDQHAYCREKKIPYVVNPGILSLRAQRECSRAAKEFTGRLRSMKDRIEDLGIFDYQGEHVPALADILFHYLQGRVKGRIKDILVAGAAVKKYRPAALVLNDDQMGDSRAWAAIFEKYRIPVFVISHGIPGHNHEIADIGDPCGIGKTIVNSQFEKEKYCMLGWSPDSTVVLGLPKYDEILKIANRPQERKRKRVLYCPNCLDADTNNRALFLNFQARRDVIRNNTLTVLESVADVDCELVIKPHFVHEMKAWQRLLKEHGSENITLVSAKEDIYDLLNGSDLLITTFSNVVIEALMFGKDVITINFTDEPDIHPYAQRGVTMGVRNAEDLADAVRQCLFDDNRKNALADKRKEGFEYFCGFDDEMNTARVTDYILDGMP